MNRIYLDHSATTPVRDEVIDAMSPFWRGAFGNAGSVHAYGREARRAVDDARDRVAALINADPREIVFTSGGTESDNLAIRGVLECRQAGRHRVLVSAVEHHAVSHAAAYAVKSCGAELVEIPVDSDGIVRMDVLQAELDGRTALVSIMHANNETGTVQPVEEIAALCNERGVLFHCDTVQSAGKLPIDVQQWPVSLLAISGHKLYGPKGIGACFVRTGIELAAQSVGGAQERERRAGTENVPGIVGLGMACALAQREMAEATARIASLRDQLEAAISAHVDGARFNGSRIHRLPTIANVAFADVDGESLVLALDVEGIAVSSGAACTSGSLEPSHVLLAMGLSYKDAQSAIRFSLGMQTTTADIAKILQALLTCLGRLR